MICWFEIPVIDMNRAIAFYESVFAFHIKHHNFGTTEMALISKKDEKLKDIGALVLNKEHYFPNSSEGILIFFQSSNLQKEMNLIEKSGGTILRPKTQINEELGFMGLFLDSEGNRIGLRSLN